MCDLAGMRVLVLGLGISGRSAARFCAARGARVVAADERAADALGELGELPAEVETRTGAAFPDPAGFDLVVPSPGVPRERYANGARRVWGDIELAWRALSVPVVAVTGTNGKSTTVCLLEAMLRATGLRARAAGNVGTPALSLVGEPLDAAVLEVSSFQLETTEAFRPGVAVVLNVTPDHIDRHGDFAGYVQAKRHILANQTAADTAVLNFDDPVVREMAAGAAARIVPFRRQGPLERGVIVESGAIHLRDASGNARFGLDGLRLHGAHNLENVAAALAAAWSLGADPKRAVRALADFPGLPHRIEVVATAGGVTWINDSKATNAAAAQRSLEGIAEPVVWIAGGSDKGAAFDALADATEGRVRHAILIGETAARLERALRGRVPVELADSLEKAVGQAARLANPGDVVLLSPACASTDQFSSFEERGERFRAAVSSLASDGGPS